MKAIIQRVLSASVKSEGKLTGEINKGFCIYVGFKVDDKKETITKFAHRICSLRIFEDENDKLNLNLSSIGGEILLISNFTIYANASESNRPSFIKSMPAQEAKEFYDLLLAELNKLMPNKIKSGIFKSDMIVQSVIDGPINIILEM